MIRIFNDLPHCGTVVIVKITTVNKITQLHDCILLEYGNIPGKIIRANCSNRETAKDFQNLKIGMIIPVICEKNNMEEELFVPVSFPTLEKDVIKRYKENFNCIIRIINTITMMFININNSNEINKPDKILAENENIRNQVQEIIDEIMSSFDTIDDVINAFFSNTLILHQNAKTWEKCKVINNFHEKLLIKFPLPKESLVIRFKYLNYYCNSVLKITEMLDKVTKLITDFDKIVTVKIAIDTIPFYRISIGEIETNNLVSYVDNIKRILSNKQHFDENFEMFKIESEEIQSSRLE